MKYGEPVQWPLWGRPCGGCGKPVYPPTTVHMKAATVLNDRIWHGDCFPPEGISATITAGTEWPPVSKE